MGVEGRQKGPTRNRMKADRFAANVLPVVRELQANGLKSYLAIARELERRGIKTARGGDSYPVQAANIVKETR